VTFKPPPAFVGVGQDLLKALEENGFVYLSDHGIPKQDVADFMSSSLSFFTLPEETKKKYMKPDFKDQGYVAPGQEALDRHKKEEGPVVRIFN